jgi:Beta-lactamase enzyme family/Polyglycine hydrolase-like, structural repeat
MDPLNTMSRSPFYLFAACALAVFLFLFPAAAMADIDPERIEDAQTGWWYLSNVTEAQINQVINDEGARLIDIEIYTVSPLRFTAAFVRNSGTYASGWWWYFGQSIVSITAHLDENNARLIDIERYVDGTGVERFAAIMVPNSGADAKAWWWYVGVTAADVTTYINRNEARLVDIESYMDPLGTQRYAVVMLKNTGEDAAGWAWFYNTDLATIQNYMSENNMRILEFEVRNPSTPTFDAILISNSYHPPQTWWWYYNVPFDQLDDLANQAGSRIVDIDYYQISGQNRYNVVMLNNSSSLTVEMGGLLDWGSDGDTGVYLRELGGSTLASLQPDFQFKAASTMKAVYNLHTMRQVQAGNISLGQPINYSINYSGSCPIGGAPTTTQTLRETLRRMMVNSDNAATKAISDMYGFPALTNTAVNVAGMNSTSINHVLGCGADALANPNTLTLRDAGELYDRIQTLQVLNEPMRDTYYSVMQNQDTPGPWWFTTDLEDTIDEVATSLGILPTADSYWAATRTAWKPGGYTLIFSGTNHEYISVAGIVSLPTCASFPVVYRDFVFGVFVHDASNNADAFNRVRTTAKELFRDVIASAMRTCPSAVEDDLPLVADVMLQQNFPNPFNPSTRLIFQLDQPQRVNLSVYDSAGRRVAVVADELFEPGRHEETWHGRDEEGRLVPAGIYFARLRAGERIESMKMALIK